MTPLSMPSPLYLPRACSPEADPYDLPPPKKALELPTSPQERFLAPPKIQLAISCAQEAIALSVIDDHQGAFVYFLKAADHLKIANELEEHLNFLHYVDNAIEQLQKLQTAGQETRYAFQLFEKITKKWSQHWADHREPDSLHVAYFEKLADFYAKQAEFFQSLNYTLRAAVARGRVHTQSRANFKRALHICYLLPDHQIRLRLQKVVRKAIAHYQEFSIANTAYAEFWKELAMHCRKEQLYSLARSCFDLAALCHLAEVLRNTGRIKYHWLQAIDCYEESLKIEESPHYIKGIRNCWIALFYQFLNPLYQPNWAPLVLDLYKEHLQYLPESAAPDYRKCIENYYVPLQREFSSSLEVDWIALVTLRGKNLHYLLHCILTIPRHLREPFFSFLHTLEPKARENTDEIAKLAEIVANDPLVHSEDLAEITDFLYTLKAEARTHATRIRRSLQALLSSNWQQRLAVQLAIKKSFDQISS